jgi:hypothetical protein
MFPFASAYLLAVKVHTLQKELLAPFSIEVFILDGESDD